MKKHKVIKISAFFLLIISALPWLYTLGLSIYNIFAGIPFFYNSPVYGLGAFLGTWLNCFMKAWFVYLAAGILTCISIITAIAAINKDIRKE